MRQRVMLQWSAGFCFIILANFINAAPDCPSWQVCSSNNDGGTQTDNRGPHEGDQTDNRGPQEGDQTDNRGPGKGDQTDNRRPCDYEGGCDHENAREIQKKPNIIFILMDDVGWNDVGWHNKKFDTPHMNQLAKEGVILENHYSLPICTPSRASFLSGYHASRLGLQRGVLQLTEPYGIPTKFKLLPQALKELEYSTHAIGKWHVGYCNKEYTPMGRGFDTFYGFYNGAENNYQHCNRDDTYFSGPNCSYYDFRDGWNKGRRYQGEFSGHLYGKRAEYIIKKHDRKKPMFMYLALSHTHFPLQAPKQYCRNCGDYDSIPARKEMCCAMAAVDSVVKNVTDALKRRRMYDNTVIVVVSDNGGSVHFGANNYPLKGNKGSLWEGGSKTPAFIHSPLIKKPGYKNKNLFHITDWYPTFVRLAGGVPDRELDGYDQWNSINLRKKSDRHDILYNVDNQTGTWFAAVRVDDMKIVIAPPASQEPNEVYPESKTDDQSFNVTFIQEYTNSTQYSPESVQIFLYNLTSDPSETTDLSKSTDPALQATLKRMREFSLGYYVSVMKPAVKIANDPAGSPEKDDNWYWVGWCNRYYDVPVKKAYSDLLINYPR